MSTLTGTAGAGNGRMKKALVHLVLFMLVALMPEHAKAQSSLARLASKPPALIAAIRFVRASRNCWTRFCVLRFVSMRLQRLHL